MDSHYIFELEGAIENAMDDLSGKFAIQEKPTP